MVSVPWRWSDRPIKAERQVRTALASTPDVVQGGRWVESASDGQLIQVAMTNPDPEQASRALAEWKRRWLARARGQHA